MGKSLTFFVAGEPQPFPKKRTNKAGMIYAYDPDGRKKAWAELVAIRAKVARNDWEASYGIETFYFPRRTPVAMGIQVFRTRPNSNKDNRPVTKPDLDNYRYTVWNTLEGILYDNDSQIVEVICPEGLWWAGVDYIDDITKPFFSNEAGMRITVREVQ